MIRQILNIAHNIGVALKVRDLKLNEPKAWNPALWNLGGAQSVAGVAVNEFTAMNYSAVYCAINLISSTIASLPLHLYRRTDNGKKLVRENWLYEVMHTQASEEMTAFDCRQTLTSHLLGWGNCYAEKITDRLGSIIEIFPITPDRVDIIRGENSRLLYEIRVGNRRVRLGRDRIMHIPGLGYDGIRGYSVITMAAQSIGLGLAAEEFGARFFGQGTHYGVVVSHPAKLSTQAHDNLKQDLTDKYSGLGKSHKLLLLEEGMKIEKVGLSPQDSQFLQTREFQIPEVARWFNVPPHKLKDLSRSSFNNIEQEQMAFVVDTIRPWLVRIEQNYNIQLLTYGERARGLFFEHALEGLLRGDAASRASYYNTLFNLGAISPNEIREKENMNSIPDGDVYFIPLNMTTIDKAKELPAGKEEPKKQLPEPNKQTEAPPSKEETEFLSTEMQQRSDASASRRDKAIARYYPLLKDAAQRIINRESIAIKKQIKKPEGRSHKDQWLKNFYAEMPDYIKKTFGITFNSFADEIRDIALDEVGRYDINEEEYRGFVNDYIDHYAERHVGKSINELSEIIDGDPDAVEQRINDWHETRAEIIAKNETVRGCNAVVTTVFFAFGINAVWRTRGKSCAYCQKLSGRKIKRNEVFASDGDTIHPDGHEEMKVNGIKRHPPLHRGCDCYISSR